LNPETLIPGSLVSFLFLGITLSLLVYKLERPDRFLWVLTRPQWRSWLTRGAVTMAIYSGLLATVVLTQLIRGRPPNWLLSLTAVAAAASALYSAFLFNQAKGRDLWQSPVLPLHRLSHALVAGAAMLILIAPFSTSFRGFEDILIQIFAAGLALNLLALGAEFNSRHPTEDAEAAAALILTGRYRAHFWLGVFILGNLVPVLFLTQGWAVPAAMLALFGLGLFDEVFVRAGQSIPLS
jgi:formate-dependent nitrite reductase membrane component NrfD